MAEPTRSLEPLRADPARAAILCDIDGTLAPIVDDPEAAAVPAGGARGARRARRALRLVACVSGRRASAARRMVGLDQLTYAGNHGLELLGARRRASPRLDPALGHRGAAAAGLRRPARLGSSSSRVGLRLEDKGPIQAIHWRGARRPGDRRAARARDRRARRAEEGLVPHLGPDGARAAPAGDGRQGDRGAPAGRRAPASRGALFGGDDRTDLDAFAALRELAAAGELEHAVCVGVASAEGPPEIERDADLVVAGPPTSSSSSCGGL